MNAETGKWLIVAAAGLLIVGIVVYFFHDKLHWIGNLPGDIRIERENFRFYFPLTTMIVISLLINIIIRLFRWLN
jgi:H+/Cl- antiporter ClcA